MKNILIRSNVMYKMLLNCECCYDFCNNSSTKHEKTYAGLGSCVLLVVFVLALNKLHRQNDFHDQQPVFMLILFVFYFPKRERTKKTFFLLLFAMWLSLNRQIILSYYINIVLDKTLLPFTYERLHSAENCNKFVVLWAAEIFR